MTVNTENKATENENVVNDLSEEAVVSTEVEDKLTALRSKMAAQKGAEMPPRIVEKKTHSIKFGIVGTGQAGSRLAETFYKLGYNAVVFNTASQDLEHIKLPESNKYLLQYGLGGAAKDLDIGKAAAEAHRDSINELVHEKLSDTQVIILCLSLGGGSGAGSCETMIDVLSTFGKPLIVITVLPMSTEDAQVKRNALETLNKLANAAKNKQIHNLIVVDNAKIETIYNDVSQFDFFEVSNQAIVAPLDAFNTLSSKPSSVKPLDAAEFAKLMIDGGGLTVYGQMTVADYEGELAIAEAVVENLNNGLLASGFDLKQAKYVGVILEANKSVWDKIPHANINYAMSMVQELCGPTGVFRGIYATDLSDNVVKVYSMFSGMGLPSSRVEQLKKETQNFAEKVKNKDTERNLNLKLDTGTDETTSAAERIKQKIAAKNSAFGNLMNNTTQDRRKK